nr:four-carbon acid sugar kinase family protein [Egibacter rhizosphaerae]
MSQPPLQLGCVADDYTGGADVAAALRRGGLRTLLLFGGTPESCAGSLPPVDAVVVALKTRHCPAGEAVEATRVAARWLRELGAPRLFVKYCSTFDPSDEGNIGPVCDALVDEAGASLAAMCPSSPEHRRTMYQGHLFVDDVLLSESSLRDHPLTPMTDSSIVRVLGRQTPHDVGLVDLPTVHAGAEVVRDRLEELAGRGTRYAVTDVVSEDDLDELARATVDDPVVTGGAGLAGALARHLPAAALPADDDAGGRGAGPVLVLSGSCSEATLRQLAVAREAMPAHRLDLVEHPSGSALAARAARCRPRRGPRGAGTRRALVPHHRRIARPAPVEVRELRQRPAPGRRRGAGHGMSATQVAALVQ